jgi:ParB family chromosome partitioning protein
MKTVDLPMQSLNEAPWNPNQMDHTASERLKESLSRYGLVQPLVVRRTGKSRYEVLNGNQRLRVMREANIRHIPCVVVELDDSEAMLLAQALNGIRGEDDLAMKGALFKKILATIPQERILSLLPETAEGLQALSTIGQDDMAQHLEAWQQAQAARLRHMQLQFSSEQLETVEKALDMVMAKARNSTNGNPNIRGVAMYLLARFYLERSKKR